MAVKKHFQFKVYDSAGTFVDNISPDIIASDPKFPSEMNGGFGECVITLKVPFDDFREGTFVDYGNLIKVYEFDSANVAGRLIYSGVVTSYRPTAEIGTQYVEVVTLGLINFLTRSYFKNGVSYTVDYGVSTGSAADPGTMIKDIIDQVLTLFPNCGLHYTAPSITLLGSTIKKKFEKKPWLTAIEEAFALYGAGYFWRIEKDGLVTVSVKPASATHTFEFNKNIDQASVEKTDEEISNTIRVEYTGGTYDAADATSVAAYGTREKIVSASEINDATAAQKKAEQYLADNKDPKIATEMTINSTFDIESVKVGDTCKVLGLKTGNNPFGSNMQIKRVRYEGDTINITLEDSRANFGDAIDKFVNS